MEACTSQCTKCQENNDVAVGDLLHVPVEKALRTVVSSKLKYHLQIKNCTFIWFARIYMQIIGRILEVNQLLPKF